LRELLVYAADKLVADEREVLRICGEAVGCCALIVDLPLICSAVSDTRTDAAGERLNE
jgi:hypothetical protein